MAHWRKVQPFGLRSPEQFRVRAAACSAKCRVHAGIREVRQLGAKTGAQRSQDQSHYAAFWYELSDIGWNRIGRVVSRQRSLDLADSTRLFALLNVALADAYIAGWDSKVHYNWRPCRRFASPTAMAMRRLGPMPTGSHSS
jgi:hypothetical protein